MKSYMKKLIGFIFAFAFVFIGSQSVFAVGPFNGQPGDCPSIAIGNYDTQVGIRNGTNGCWSLSSISANAGETINVVMFYHNNTNQSLTNVKASISPTPSGSVNSYSFSGIMSSDQGTTSLGSVNVNLTSQQTISFSSAYWFNNRNNVIADIDVPFPNGQSPSAVINGGIYLGTIPPGWNDYGYVLVSFKIGDSYTPPQTQCSVYNFQPTQNNITAGDSVSFTWSDSNCTSFTVEGVRTTSGVYRDYPSFTKTYTLIGYGPNNTSTASTTVTVNTIQKSQCYVSNFSASPSNVTSGSPVTLTWSSNADTFSIPTINWTNSNVFQTTVWPTTSTTYTLFASGNNCSSSASSTTYVTVNQNNTTPSVSTYMPSYIGETSATISGYANSNSGYGNINAWLEFPCYSSTKYSNQYNLVSTNLSSTISNLNPNTTYSYCAVAQTNNGTIYRGNNISFTTKTQYTPQPAFTALTSIATNVSKNSANINGLVTNATSSTNIYFEYGKTAALGNRTSTRIINSGTNIPVAESINGLASNTTYYFRLVGESNGAVSRGIINIFKTSSDGSKVIIIPGKTITEESPIMLKIENRYEGICNSNIVDYTVTYKNIGKNKLTQPIVQIVLPSSIDFTNSSTGTYDNSNRTLSIPLEDLKANEEGIIYVQGKANSQVKNNDQIVTTAVLVYTNPNGAQENVIAYSINNPGNCNSLLGASAFWSGWSFGGLLWWLLIIVIILLAILIARTYRKKNYNNGVSKSSDIH